MPILLTKKGHIFVFGIKNDSPIKKKDLDCVEMNFQDDEQMKHKRHVINPKQEKS
jgi:hypothetical protein